MNWTKLYATQKELDNYIKETQALPSEKDLFQDKLLALLVELGELANETRCFKFWSKKGRSEQDTILEEYVDGIHFILSLGIDKGFTFSSEELDKLSLTETEYFSRVFTACISFGQQPTKQNYDILFVNYLQLGEKLGFNEQDIQKAYYAKNEINIERQNRGY